MEIMLTTGTDTSLKLWLSPVSAFKAGGIERLEVFVHLKEALLAEVTDGLSKLETPAGSKVDGNIPIRIRHRRIGAPSFCNNQVL